MKYYKLRNDDNYTNISHKYIQRILRGICVNSSSIKDIIINDIKFNCARLIVIPYIYNNLPKEFSETNYSKLELIKIDDYIKLTYVFDEIIKIIDADVIYTTDNTDGSISSFRTYIIYRDKCDNINMAYYVRYNNSIGFLYKIYGNNDPNYPLGIIRFDKFSTDNINNDLDIKSNNNDEITKKILDIYNDKSYVSSIIYHFDNEIENYFINSTFLDNDLNSENINIELCSKSEEIHFYCLNYINKDFYNRVYLKVNNNDKSTYYNLFLLNFNSTFLKEDYKNQSRRILCVYNPKVGFWEEKEKILSYNNKFNLDIKTDKLKEEN